MLVSFGHSKIWC